MFSLMFGIWSSLKKWVPRVYVCFPTHSAAHAHTHTHPLGSLGSVSTSKLSPLRTQDWTRAANSQSWGRHSKQHLSKVHAGGLPRKQSKLQTVVLMKLSLFAQGQKKLFELSPCSAMFGLGLGVTTCLAPRKFQSCGLP